MRKIKPNPYKELCEDMFAIIESLALSITDIPGKYLIEGEFIDVDGYEKYLEEVQSLCSSVSCDYIKRLCALDPSYAKVSPLFRLLKESEKAYLSEKAQMNEFFRSVEVAKQRESYRPLPLSVVSSEEGL